MEYQDNNVNDEHLIKIEDDEIGEQKSSNTVLKIMHFEWNEISPQNGDESEPKKIESKKKIDGNDKSDNDGGV